MSGVPIPLRRGESGELVDGSLEGDLLVWDATRRMFVPRQFVAAPLSAGSILVSSGGNWVETRGAEGDLLQFRDGVWKSLARSPTNGLALTLDNGYPTWNDIGLGTFNRFDTRYGPVVLYKLENDVLDYSGNGFHLQTASPVFTEMVPGYRALVCTRHNTNTFASGVNLRRTGSLTAYMFAQLNLGGNASVFAWDGGGETQAGNILYSVQLGDMDLLGWAQESGAGVNSTYSPSGFVWPPVHNNVVLTVRRAADQRIQFFINGRTAGALSGALTTPDGGDLSTARLWIGGDASAVHAQMICGGFALYFDAHTDAQIAEIYNHVAGSAYGVVHV